MRSSRLFALAFILSTTFTVTQARKLDVKYVDLGLSVLWADCNMGADSPTDYGSYFAWGETEPKNYFSWDNFHNCEIPREEPDSDDEDFLGRSRNNEPLRLPPANDAATVRLGAEWHMPTIQEYNEKNGDK